MTDTVSLDDLNAASAVDFARHLAGIVEHAPEIAAGAAAMRPFATVAALHEALFGVIAALARDRQVALVARHPELAGREAASGDMTRESVSEQGSAGLDRLSSDDVARLGALNRAYRERFGIPFLICVRRHTRRSIFAEAERRLARGPDEELAEALHQIFLITRLRIVDRVTGPGLPVTTGRLSTHVLDTVAGRPAEGVEIELRDVSEEGAGVLMTTATTNRDGRLDAPLIGGRPLRIGIYELAFRIGPYFAARHPDLPAEPFLSVVPIRFGIAEPEAHYHVPLTVTPWSYSTYRGS